MLYVDDVLLFLKADENNAKSLRKILNTFGDISGLRINLEKSYMFVKDQKISASLKEGLGLDVSDLPVRYLGLPLFSGHLSKVHYRPLLDKIKRRLEDWKVRLLSMVGRLELIMSTLNAYSLFWTSAFLIPSSVVKEIEQVCRNFLWGDKESKKRYHSLGWEKVCLPKSEGGLGIRKVGDLIKARAMLNLWNIVRNKESLWVRWVHGRYLIKNQSIWLVQAKQKDFWIWRKLLANRGCLRKYVSYVVGSGSQIKLWTDP